MATAQVRIMPAPVNAPILEMTMYDDGCGVAIWDSAGVFVTHDHWESSSEVVPPGVEPNFEFVPRSVDTASTGAVIVVGFLRTGRNDGPIFTYAMRSIDHGRTWAEIGARRSGRFQSLSFRGSAFGLAVYEMRQSNKRGASDTFAIYIDQVDDRLNVVSTVTFVAPNQTGYDCYAGEDAVTCVITSLGTAGALLSVVSPCRYYNHQEPDPSVYWTSLYRSTQPDGEYLRVTTLPPETKEGVKRYRWPQSKEAVFGDSVFSGLMHYETIDNGLTWGNIRCHVTGACLRERDSLGLWAGSSDVKNGAVLESYGSRACPDVEGVRMWTFYKVWPRSCSILEIDSVVFTWPFENLTYVITVSPIGKHIQYGNDGIVYSDFYSFESADKLYTRDSLFLCVRIPTTTTSTPNTHTAEQASLNIRVAASTIHVRMPMRTQMDRTLRIVDVTGREIRSHDVVTENEVIYIGDLPRGMYYAFMPGVRAISLFNP